MSSLNIGVTGLLTAQRALDTIGQNIANVSTPGYARREVRIGSSAVTADRAAAGAGGVTVGSIARIKDLFLQGRLNTYQSGLSGAETLSRYYLEIESLLSEPGDNGIGAAISQFYNQWQTLASRPEDSATRNALLSAAENLARSICDLQRGLSEMRLAISQELKDSVGSANNLVAQLAQNNLLIDQAVSGGQGPLDLEDNRDDLLRRLADLLGVGNLTPGEAKAAVSMGGVNLVSGVYAVELVAPASAGDGLQVRVGEGLASVEASGGKIGALIDLDRDVIAGYMARLDSLAQELMRTVNAVHAQGVPLSGRFTEIVSTAAARDLNGSGDPADDLLRQAGLPFAPSSGNLTINLVDSAGLVTPHTLRIDPDWQSLRDVAEALNAVPRLSATVESGRLVLRAEAGCSFDFAADQGSDLLAALGLNAFFTGSGAADIALSPDIAADPARIAAARTAEPGDGANALALSALAQSAHSGVATLAQLWQDFVVDVGSASSHAARTAETMQSMVSLLRDQEQAVAGVSLDEEAAKMLQYQQMYSACARYISTVSKLSQELLNYV
jgi:flagellar hook-associated protein 1 FlgK